MSSQTECPICYDVINDINFCKTSCGHVFHTTCIIDCVTRSGPNCPCCRALIRKNDRQPSNSLESIIESAAYSESRYMNILEKHYFKPLSVQMRVQTYMDQDEFEERLNVVIDETKRKIGYSWDFTNPTRDSLKNFKDIVWNEVEREMDKIWKEAKRNSRTLNTIRRNSTRSALPRVAATTPGASTVSLAAAAGRRQIL